MAQIDFFKWGKELSPEAREATNAAFNAYLSAHTKAAEALEILKAERCAFDRTRAEIAQQMRIDAEVMSDTAARFERWAQENGAAPNPTETQTAEAVRVYATQIEGIYKQWEPRARALGRGLYAAIEQSANEYYKEHGTALPLRECMCKIVAVLLDEVAEIVSFDLLEDHKEAPRDAEAQPSEDAL